MTSVSELKNVLKPTENKISVEDMIEFYKALECKEFQTSSKSLKVPALHDYKDTYGYQYHIEKRYLVEQQGIDREDYVLASLGYWAPNGTIWWSYAFSDVSDKFMAFSESDESKAMLGKKRRYFSNSDLEALDDLFMVRRILTDDNYVPTKSQRKRLEELYSSCSLIDLGTTEKADYVSLDDISEDLIKMFNIPKSNDYDFMGDNIYKYVEWIVSIYNNIFSSKNGSPRVSRPIRDFELNWVARHKFSDEIIKTLVEKSNAAQVFIYFAKAL